ncbi:MAG TPA: tetratricopeptide repeat protein, partial [Candidatus Binatia bacterium]|nr:tetratricopeptide repeat protein [Candidatus Binatia bacterium]
LRRPPAAGAPVNAAAAVAVLPFENLSGDPGQDYFARGFVEDLVTELSRFPTLEVLAPRTSLALPGPLPAERWCEALPVAYLLQGSVRRVGDTVRVAARLVEAPSGRQLWGDRFDARAEDLLAVQDEIVARVAAALSVEIDGARLRQARRKPLASLEVYDCWLRGLDCLRRGSVEDDERARAFFERALALDPHWARAHAGLSLSHFNEWSCQAWERWDDKERLAYEHACRAAALDDRDAVIQMVLGRILIYRRRFDEAAGHVDRAIALNPNDADVLAQAALCRAYLGQPESAVALAAKAVRLNPRHPEWYAACAAVPLFLLGRYAEAVGVMAPAPRATVDLPAYLAAAHALDGDGVRAAAALRMFLGDLEEKILFGRSPEPGEPLRWLLHVNPFRRAEDAEHLARGLALAGLAADPDERRPRAAALPVPEDRPEAVFRREGGFWTLAFEGLTVQLTEAKGFHDLAALLARPETRVHCLELAGRSAEPHGADPALDARARRELTDRAQELQEEIEDAEARHDLGRAERAREELDRIVEVLAGALGLGGRPRRPGSAAERARTAVTWRIRNAIRKIAAVHPALGRHLDNAVRTGTSCAYTPDRLVAWTL